ncbi:hypothetical protein [Streptomyces sp. NPDC002587]
MCRTWGEHGRCVGDLLGGFGLGHDQHLCRVDDPLHDVARVKVVL